MRIIIIGNGQIGERLIENISAPERDIVLIDCEQSKIDKATNKYDVRGVMGNGACREVQMKAGVEGSDLFIAVTNSDEVNIMSCIVAKKMGARNTIAKVSNVEYLKDTQFLSTEFGVDIIINPENNTAHEITRLVQFPNLIRIEAFSNGLVDMAEINIESKHPIVGMNLKELQKKYGSNILVCAANRNGEVFIPKGNFVIKAGDKISIIASHEHLSDFFEKIGVINPIKNVMIVGGGKISRYLAAHLQKMRIKMKLIDENQKKCVELSEKFDKVEVVCGNGTDSELMLGEELKKNDACIALTGKDEDNLVISMFAKHHNISKVIAEIDNISFSRMLNDVKVNNIISMYDITVQEILRYVLGIENSISELNDKSSILMLHEIVDNKVRAIEFKVGADYKYSGLPLMSDKIKIKSNVLIASILRGADVINPTGKSTLESGDRVIIVTTDKKIKNLTDILA